MSLDTPTTKELSDNIIAQLEATLNQTIPLFPKAFNRVLAKVFAGVFIILYKYAGSIFLQQYVQTASTKDTTIFGIVINPLTFWGRLIGVGGPVPATNAELTIDITVENQTGFLASGSALINANNGYTYITLGEVALDAATVSATIKAVDDQTDTDGAGAAGNLEIGDPVSFANALPNVAKDAIVTGQAVTGANAEDLEVYRQRIIDRFQKKPQGGAYADYEQWGEEVAGIINVYPYTSDCPGQVDVYSEATVESSGSADGIPTTAQLQAVLDNINFDQDGIPTRRPANCLVNSLPITRREFDIDISDLIADDLNTTKNNIQTAIDGYLLGREPFISGLSILPRRDQITKNALGGIIEDVVSAAGGSYTDIVLKTDSLVITTYTLSIGEKSKTGVISYI